MGGQIMTIGSELGVNTTREGDRILKWNRLKWDRIQKGFIIR